MRMWRSWVFALVRRRRDQILRGIVQEIRALDRPPTLDEIERLRFGYANREWSASPEVLGELAKRVMCARVGVLECGSGASTVLIGALTSRTGLPFVSLEHLELWHAKTKSLLRVTGLDHVSLRLRKIQKYDGFDWYQLPVLRPERQFDLLFVDGPPGTTRGGRFGVLPCMLKRLTDDCVIILDDADRDAELQILQRWQAALPGSVVTRRKTYAVLERRPASTMQD